MSNSSGLNTDEVAEALANATSEEDKRYLERVLESRGVRKANVSSHEIVAGNPDVYPAQTVAQQEDLALGRPHDALPAEALNVRGSVQSPASEAGEQPAKSPAKAVGSKNK
jgi:hypothetical protein